MAGPTDVGWRIINIWADAESFHRFRSERLLRAAGLAAHEDDGLDPAKAARFTVLTVDGEEMPF